MASDPLVGKTLAEFEVLEAIGQGGMGVVYKGRQKALDRLVAIKVLSPDLAQKEGFIERFEREARTAAALRHPNIVQVYSVGEAQGVHYIAMEYVDGEGLDKVLERDGPLPPPRALDILKQVCAALVAAHEAGVVHRDIKPSNLMLDSRGVVRVTDFGLAKRTEGDVSVTQTGQALGTPLYMAPEVASGAPATAQSDLYSLGATFFHLLAGRPPFEGTSFSELVVKHVTQPAPLLHEVAPNVDPRLANPVDRLLCKKFSERLPSARALLERLEGIGHLRRAAATARAEGRAMIASAPTATLTEGRRLAREAIAEQLGADALRARKRRIVLAAAVGAGLLAVALALALGRRGTPPDQQAVLPPSPPGRRPVTKVAPPPRPEAPPPKPTPPEPVPKKEPAAEPKEEPPVQPKEVPEEKPLLERAAALGLEQGLAMAAYSTRGGDFEEFVRAAVAHNVDRDWGAEAPLEGAPVDFATRFAGWLWIEQAGRHEFAFWVDDGARLYLDGKLVLDAWRWEEREDHGTVTLARGWHRIWVEHMDRGGMAAVRLQWVFGGRAVPVGRNLFFCERSMLDGIRKDPTRNPLAGLSADDPGKLGGREPLVAVKEPPKPTPKPEPKPEPPLKPPKPGEAFEETFDDEGLDNWQVVSGLWEQDRGEAVVFASQCGTLALNNREFDDFVLEADVVDTGRTIDTGFGREWGFCGLIFRQFGDKGFLFSLDTQARRTKLWAYQFIRSTPHGDVKGVAVERATKQADLKPRERHRLKVECAGTQVRCFLDGELAGEATDRAFVSGSIGLFGFRCQARFDNVRIRPVEGALPEPAGERTRRWLERAELMDTDDSQVARGKVKGWSDLLARFPDLEPEAKARARERRDFWTKAQAEEDGVITERSSKLERDVFNACVRELPGGIFRISYNLFKPPARPLGCDWDLAVGNGRLDSDMCIYMDDSLPPLSAITWLYRHGEDVRVEFKASAPLKYGCTLFGHPADPLGTGLVLSVGEEEGRVTTLGFAGQPPLYRGNMTPSLEFRRCELEVVRGELVFRYERNEVFRQKIDLAPHRGRALHIWATHTPGDREQPGTVFANIEIDSPAQRDWVSSKLPNGPPHRRCDQPDAQGWLGLEHPSSLQGSDWGQFAGSMLWGTSYVVWTQAPANENVFLAERGNVRDCMMAARCEFIGAPPAEGDGGSVGLVFRFKLAMGYVAYVHRRGGAELRFRDMSPGRFSRDRSVATGQRLPPLRGIFHLTAVVQGRRLELFCDGRPALSVANLPEDLSGKVGFEVQDGTALIHDFKWRPLLTDPNYKKLYGGKEP
ncbi:MAG: hypothetical protein FJ290_13945 [Planctomycetes bacterium]|nr:hypothetical protein [Planctomycetota bacterium]